MAVPKRKTSRSRTRSRRAQWKAESVPLVPVRVDGSGRVTKVGLLLRVAADGSISRMVVTGRVQFGELIREALSPYPEGLVIATKVKGFYAATTAAELRAEVEENLRRLGRDHPPRGTVAARGPLHGDHGGDRHAVTAVDPGHHVVQHVLHLSPPSIRSAKCANDASEFPDRKWSTCGSAACMPRVSGS